MAVGLADEMLVWVGWYVHMLMTDENYECMSDSLHNLGLLAPALGQPNHIYISFYLCRCMPSDQMRRLIGCAKKF